MTMVVALCVLPVGQIFLSSLGLQLSPFWHWLTGLFH